MRNLAGGESRSHGGEIARSPAAAAANAADQATEGGVAAERMIARARWLMVVSGLTTLIALAGVIGVIGYRVFHAGGSGDVAPADAIVALPKGARVIASTTSGERIAVTLDIGGATEIRTFDVRTLRQTGRIRFATEP